MQSLKSYLPFHTPTISEEEIAEVIKVLRSGWLTRGEVTENFETKVCSYVGAKHCIAMNSCTSALHISLVSANVGAGDEVVVPTFTFAASANVVVHTGARPVLVDIEEETFNISIDHLEDAITEKTKAIISVDYAGHPCEIDKVMKIAKRDGIFVIEDAAHSLGASFRGERIGKQADTTCFSFYVTKNITTGEGGTLVTQLDPIGEKARILSLHGMSKHAWNRYSEKGSWYYQIVDFGYKYNMNDIQAAIGLSQMRKIDILHKRREEIAKVYSEELDKLDGIIIPRPRTYVKSAWHLYPIRLSRRAGISRNKLIELLKKEGIGTSVHFIPLHLQPAYQKRFKYKKGDFPVAERVFNTILSLPIYPSMKSEDVAKVVSVISKTLQR
jgi:dTDP-4-amino-4,6-dideoxygalactose transaminase